MCIKDLFNLLQKDFEELKTKLEHVLPRLSDYNLKIDLMVPYLTSYGRIGYVFQLGSLYSNSIDASGFIAAIAESVKRMSLFTFPVIVGEPTKIGFDVASKDDILYIPYYKTHNDSIDIKFEVEKDFEIPRDNDTDLFLSYCKHQIHTAKSILTEKTKKEKHKVSVEELFESYKSTLAKYKNNVAFKDKPIFHLYYLNSTPPISYAIYDLQDTKSNNRYVTVMTRLYHKNEKQEVFISYLNTHGTDVTTYQGIKVVKIDLRYSNTLDIFNINKFYYDYSLSYIMSDAPFKDLALVNNFILPYYNEQDFVISEYLRYKGYNQATHAEKTKIVRELYEHIQNNTVFTIDNEDTPKPLYFPINRQDLYRNWVAQITSIKPDDVGVSVTQQVKGF